MTSTFLIKSVVSLTLDLSFFTSGFKYYSTNSEILLVWQLTEIITGLPGLLALRLFPHFLLFLKSRGFSM